MYDEEPIDPEASHQRQASEAYEFVLRRMRGLKLLGNAALVGFPAIGCLNVLIAHERILSPYVIGAVIGGAAIKVVTTAANRIADRAILDPILNESIERFRTDLEE